MRVKLDENMPLRLAPMLAALGHDVETVPGERLKGADDPAVWRAAQSEGRFLITQDMDFSDIRKYPPGTHAGILLVRLGAPVRMALAVRVRAVFETEDVGGWGGCLVVATDRRVRVRRAAP